MPGTAELWLASSLVLSAGSSLSPIQVQDGNFVDRDGRVRMFRGINSVIKHYPWYEHYLMSML